MSMLQDPLANPLYADPPTLAKLPPVAIHTGIAEMLQGEAAVFAQKAAKAGALVELHLYDGMFHVFPSAWARIQGHAHVVACTSVLACVAEYMLIGSV